MFGDMEIQKFSMGDSNLEFNGADICLCGVWYKAISSPNGYPFYYHKNYKKISY